VKKKHLWFSFDDDPVQLKLLNLTLYFKKTKVLLLNYRLKRYEIMSILFMHGTNILVFYVDVKIKVYYFGKYHHNPSNYTPNTLNYFLDVFFKKRVFRILEISLAYFFFFSINKNDDSVLQVSSEVIRPATKRKNINN